MATSGTYDWQMDVSDIVEEAFELAGWEGRTGNDLTTARRSLNLLLTEWSNKGVNLWTIEEDSITLTAGTSNYSLGAETIDVLTVVQRDSAGSDVPMSRISIEEYMNTPDKDTQGSVSQYAIQRSSTQPVMYVYPTPDDSTLQLVYWKIRYSQDINRFTETVDVPRRFLPALVYGLAWYLCLKKPAVALAEEAARLDRQKCLKLEEKYYALFEEAKGEDRDRASLFLRFGPR